MANGEDWRKEIIDRLRDRNKRESSFVEIIKLSKGKFLFLIKTYDSL